METTATETAPVTENADVPKDEGFVQADKYKVKVNGEEREVALNDLIERYQKEEAAEHKFQSAAQLRKEIASLEERLAKDPFGYAREKGANIEDLAEQILLEKLRWEKMTDEQKELVMSKQKMSEYEKRIQELTEKDQKLAASQAEAKAAQEIDDEISQALAELGSKPTPGIVAAIATQLLAYHEAGRQVSAKDVVKKVRENLSMSAKELISSMSVDDLRSFLPKSHLDGLRKAAVETALAQDPMRSRHKRAEKTEAIQAPKKPVSTDDYFKQMDAKFKRS
jgi:hypothetical protein